MGSNNRRSECHVLNMEEDSIGVIKLRVLRWGDYPGLAG